MKIKKTNYCKDLLSVPTESKIKELLNINKDKIDDKFTYVDILLGSTIKKYGVAKTQSFIDEHDDYNHFFICQHIESNKLKVKKGILFTPHSFSPLNFYGIPHYTMNSSYENKPNKSILFSFMGYLSTHSVRYKLISLYPESCYSIRKWGLDPGIISAEKSKLENNYIKLIEKSMFSLCPRGTGHSSIRLFETMSMGSIPIIISDNFIKPLETYLNWDDFSVTVKESDIHNIPKILSKFDSSDIKKMSDKAFNIYHKYFSNNNLDKSIIINLNGI
jgi:hypothetical protein